MPREDLGGAKTVPPLPLAFQLTPPNIKMGGRGGGGGNRQEATRHIPPWVVQKLFHHL